MRTRSRSSAIQLGRLTTAIGPGKVTGQESLIYLCDQSQAAGSADGTRASGSRSLVRDVWVPIDVLQIDHLARPKYRIRNPDTHDVSGGLGLDTENVSHLEWPENTNRNPDTYDVPEGLSLDTENVFPKWVTGQVIKDDRDILSTWSLYKIVNDPEDELMTLYFRTNEEESPSIWDAFRRARSRSRRSTRISSPSSPLSRGIDYSVDERGTPSQPLPSPSHLEIPDICRSRKRGSSTSSVRSIVSTLSHAPSSGAAADDGSRSRRPSSQF